MIKIPLIARMICVADSFDAMNSNRVYRNKLSKEAIIAEIEKNNCSDHNLRIRQVEKRILLLYNNNLFYRSVAYS